MRAGLVRIAEHDTHFKSHRESAMASNTPRATNHPIDPLFLERWSPRAFDGSKLSDTELFTILEAARWAPSSFNHQPWRFVYAHRESAHWERFVGLLLPFNAMWARHAAVLLFILSDTMIQLPRDKEQSLSHSHSFDAGAAWAFMALQATRLGIHTHGMAGVDFDRARKELSIPDSFRIEAAIAIGRLGDKSKLPPEMQGREVPSGRRDLTEFVMEGRFVAKTF
jgi:nitroreductase